VPKNTVYFVDLSLEDKGGKGVSTNFYWLANGDDFKPLRSLAPAKVQAAGSIRRAAERWVLTAELSCPAPQPIAFWIRLQVRTQSHKRPLPVFYSDNYLCLAPGARQTITADLAANDVPSGEEPELWLAGWNVKPEMRVPLARKS
jgi:hypothetical protein